MEVVYSYLRTEKAKQLKLWYDEPLRIIDSLNVECFPNAVVLPLAEDRTSGLSWGLSGINDEHNEYIHSSACVSLYDYGYKPKQFEERHEDVLYCGYFRKHWGDFLADCVHRLWYAIDNPHLKLVYFVENDGSTTIQGNYKEFFELLGVWDRIEFINKPTRYDKVFIPQLSYSRSEKYYPQQYLRIFDIISKNVAANRTGSSEQFKKIFFTRSKLQKAINMEYGMDLMDSFFADNGYRVVAPETLTLAEMIRLIRNAETVASFSGTLPHNMLFARNGQRLEIIERNALNNQYQHYFSKMRGL